MLAAALTLLGLALVFAFVLTLAAKKLALPVDARVELVAQALAGVNCGACGYAGCQGAAEAIVAGKIPVESCPVGGEKAAWEIAGILGVTAQPVEKKIALVHCAGGEAECLSRFSYRGIEGCRAAELVGGGFKSCRFGCLGLGTCKQICPFAAIEIVDGVAAVDPRLCTGCGKCIGACPRRLIELVPAKDPLHVLCSSHDKGVIVRKLCAVGCIACQACVKKAPGGELKMENFLALRDYQKPLSDRASLEACPVNSILDLREFSPAKWASRHPKREKKGPRKPAPEDKTERE